MNLQTIQKNYRRMKKGKIAQVMGPVVDVEFEDDGLPPIRETLEVKNAGRKLVMEVAQHIGNHTVRCIMLAASEGLHRGMEVTATIAATSSMESGFCFCSANASDRKSVV